MQILVWASEMHEPCLSTKCKWPPLNTMQWIERSNALENKHACGIIDFLMKGNLSCSHAKPFNHTQGSIHTMSNRTPNSNAKSTIITHNTSDKQAPVVAQRPGMDPDTPPHSPAWDFHHNRHVHEDAMATATSRP